MNESGRIRRRTALPVGLVVALACFLALCGSAQAAGGSISGRVEDESGAAVQGITVCVDGANTYSFACSSSDSEGEYAIGGLVEDEYRVEFLPESGSPYVSQYYEGARRYEDATLIDVVGSDAHPGIDAVMQEAGEIEGTVTRAAGGAGVEGIEVCAYDSEAEWESECRDTVAGGGYRIPGLAAGTYKVRFALNGEDNFQSQYYREKATSDAAELVTVASGQPTTGVDAALHEGAKIEGTVTKAVGGAAMENVSVCAYEAEGPHSYESHCTSTDGSGKYSIGGLVVGSYVVQFAPGGNFVSGYYGGGHERSEAQAIPVGEEETVTGIDAEVQLGGEIEGKVTGAGGAPLQSVSVCTVSGFYCGYTNEDGEYTIEGIAPGSYKVEFYGGGNYLTQYFEGKESSAEAEAVAVTEGGTRSNVDARMQEGGEIVGTVTAAVGGAAIEYSQVCARPTESGREYESDCASTDSAGHYVISGLRPGHYKVEFSPPYGGNYVAQYYDQKERAAEAFEVPVVAEQIAGGIDGHLREGGRLTGKVTAAAGGAGLAGVEVCATTAEFGQFCGDTDSSGNYEIDGLPGGRYQVFFDALPSGRNYVSEYYDDKASAAEANRVQVTEEQLTDGVDAALEAGAKIEGKVRAAGGDYLEGIEVCARDESEDAREGENRCVTTDADGAYTIDGLAAGDYVVEFEDEAGIYLARWYDESESAGKAETIELPAGQTRSEVDAELEEGGQISGAVTGEGAAGLEGVEVCAIPVTGEYEYAYSCGETKANGKYAITGLPTGSYKVRFSPPYNSDYGSQYYDGAGSPAGAEAIAVTAGEAHSGVDAELTRSGEIAGRVTGVGAGGLNSITVCAYDPDEEGEYHYGGWCGLTNSSGNYVIKGLPVGTFDVRFSAGFGAEEKYLAQYYDGKASASEADPVTVGEGEAKTGIDAELREGGRITGRVEDAGGHDLQGIEACAYPRDEEFGIGGRCASTGADGNYTLVGLAAGEYTVSFYGSGYLSQYYDDKESSAEAEAVPVTLGHSTPDIDATMRSGGAVEGTVTSGEGEPLADATVCAYRGSEEEFSNCTYTGSDGGYALRGLVTGSYTIEFSAGYSGGNYISQYYDGKESAAEAEAVSVTVGSTRTGIDAELRTGGEIKGTVTAEADGGRLDGVEVCASAAGGSGRSICGSTDAYGRYVIRGLAAGEYLVRFRIAEYCAGSCSNPTYGPQFYDGKLSQAEAEPVTVTAGGVVRGIDAALAAGGSITGTVTDASTHKPVQGTEVCAYRVGESEAEICAPTGSDGTYDLRSLSAGPHVVKFEGGVLCGDDGCTEPEYATQYFDGKPSAAKADPVSVTAGEETSGIDAAMAAPSEPVPTDTSAPEITGAAVVGQTLTCAKGSWTGDPTDYEYAWLRGTVTIDGAEASTYVVQEADAGHELSCRVTATNGGGSASATSDTVSIPAKPSAGALPQVTGTLAVGEQLTCEPGTWSGGPSFAYAWLRDGDAIGGAGQAFYTVVQGDVGHELACRVRATNSSGSTEATSAAVHVPAKPVDTTPPSVAGTAAVGQTLTCNPGAWEHGPTFSYAWLRGAEPISGAEASTYEVQTADQGQNIACEVTATNGDGSATATSPSFPIPAAVGAPGNTTPPEITGTPALGQTLTCSQGVWTNDPTSYEYAWRRGATPISGAAAAGYVVQEDDAGAELSCVVTARNVTGPQSATSAAVEVPAKPTDTTPPEITGTAAVGQTLTCARGSWTGDPTGYGYAWLRGATPIDGAEASTYVVQGADGGHELRCKVTATNGGGSTSATSEPVSVPVPPQAPVDTALPEITGTPALGQTLTCSQGSWSNDPTSYGYAWLRGGAPIGGATGSTYGIQTEDQGQSLACRVTASNTGGSTDATSHVVQVPAASSGGGGGAGSGGGSGETSSSSTSSGTASGGQSSPPSSATPTTPTKPRQGVGACKKGFVKKKLHGKAQCVKKPKPKKGKKHPKRK